MFSSRFRAMEDLFLTESEQKIYILNYSSNSDKSWENLQTTIQSAPEEECEVSLGPNSHNLPILDN